MDDPIVQAIVWTWATMLALAVWEHSIDNRRAAALAVLAAMTCFVAGVITMSVNDTGGDPLTGCRESGSYQMVYIDGGWQCVPPGQEG